MILETDEGINKILHFMKRLTFISIIMTEAKSDLDLVFLGKTESDSGAPHN